MQVGAGSIKNQIIFFLLRKSIDNMYVNDSEHSVWCRVHWRWNENGGKTRSVSAAPVWSKLSSICTKIDGNYIFHTPSARISSYF